MRSTQQPISSVNQTSLKTTIKRHTCSVPFGDSEGLERITQVSEGQVWYLLYNSKKAHIRVDLIKRLIAAE